MRIGPFLTSSIAFQERYNLTINNMAPPNAEAVAVQVDQEIYGRSGDLDKHMEGVKAQYDTKEKLEFYAQVMGDGTANIHFGKWDVSLSQCHKFTQSHRDRLSYQHALLLGHLHSPHRYQNVNIDEEGAYGKASEQMTGRSLRLES